MAVHGYVGGLGRIPPPPLSLHPPLAARTDDRFCIEAVCILANIFHELGLLEICHAVPFIPPHILHAINQRGSVEPLVRQARDCQGRTIVRRLGVLELVCCTVCMHVGFCCRALYQQLDIRSTYHFVYIGPKVDLLFGH